MHIEGPRIETFREYVATRDMPAVKVPRFATQIFRGGDVVYHGAAPELTAGPGLEIVGTVRDKDSGRLLPGIVVQTTGSLGNLSPEGLRATTDTRGDYQLSGLPLKDEYDHDHELLASATEGPPYVALAAARRRRTRAGLCPQGLRPVARRVGKGAGHRSLDGQGGPLETRLLRVRG